MVLLSTTLFGCALWFGLYLLNRLPGSAALRFAGLGLVSYALALATQTITTAAADAGGAPQSSSITPVFLLPAICWNGALLVLLPTSQVRRWANIAFIAAIIAAAAISGFALASTAGPQSGAHAAAATLVFTSLALAIILNLQEVRQKRPTNIAGVLLTATLFYGLGIALLLLPQNIIPREWMLLAVGGDLALLGFAIVRLDAFAQGEALLPDLLRSFDAALLAALLFGGQVTLVIVVATGSTPAMLMLLHIIIASAIALVVLKDVFERLLDTFVFARLPQLQQAREDLRSAAQVLPRIAPAHALDSVDADEFVQLTRRALSQLGSLPRLASSPLAQLPIIDTRIAARRAPNDTLERAAELRSLLIERIERLRPHAQANFNSGDEWRFYNALYFPYVAGLKPYSRRNTLPSDPRTRDAFHWLQQIPERTLYNWQNSAARLIAQDLRESLAE